MKAAVSGRAAAAIVIDGDKWVRIDNEEPSVIKPSGPHDWPFVFGVSQDTQFVEADSFDEIRCILSTAADENQGLTLALICLDMGSEFQTKIEAAHHLEQIIARTRSTLEFLWRVFAAKPLPRDASVDDACDASPAAAQVQQFFIRLRQSQPAITRVNEAWQVLPDHTFAEVNRGDFRSFTIHSGIWQCVVEASLANRTPQFPAKLDLPHLWSAAQVDQILHAWAKLILETPEPRQMIRVLETRQETVIVTPAEGRTLFAATDVEMETLQQVDFHGSLINNLLLRQQLVIPDVYFFTSRGIANHLSSPDTLLEHAIASGLVVAASRYRGADFETTYKVMRRQRIVLKVCDYVARLQRAAERNPDGPYLYWPNEGMSTAYERYLSVLEADAPPAMALHAAGDSDLARHWDLTRDWRTSLIGRARDATQRRGGTGVYKRELFHQLKVAVGHDTHEITGIGSLLSAVSKELVEKVRIFWSWVAEGHRFSRARMLDALIYSPGYERVQNLFVTSALGSVAGSNPLHVEMDLPSTSTLKELSARQIIDLRRGPGADYFLAIDRCRRNPDEREQVKNALEQYAAETVKVCENSIGRIQVKRVELSVGLPSSTDIAASRRQQFLAMTTFDSLRGRLYDQYLRGKKIGGVTVNKKTDVCVANDLPETGER
jgi:hypothetical protein